MECQQTYILSQTDLKVVHQILSGVRGVVAVTFECWIKVHVTSGPASLQTVSINSFTSSNFHFGVMRISKTAESSGGTTFGWSPP